MNTNHSSAVSFSDGYLHLYFFSELNWRWQPLTYSLQHKSAEQWRSFCSLKGTQPKKGIMTCKLQWMKKVLPIWQLKTWLLGLRQDISTLERLCSKVTCGQCAWKCGWHSKHDLRQWEIFSPKYNKDPGAISGICKVHVSDVSDM